MPDSGALRHRVVDRLVRDTAAERGEVIAGLEARPARIAPKYFYDDLGCALYGAIVRLPEYYPPRAEAAIFARHRAAIAEAVGRRRQWVDLGAGDCGKARWWLPFADAARYIAVDIAADELERSLARLAPDFPDIEMTGLAVDFGAGLDMDGVLGDGAALFFYPGSSIGNFAPPEAVAFLASIRRHCATRPGSGLLIGVDAKKDRATLDRAYDDAVGVTAAFNRNVLRHLNRRFGFDFAPERFTHVAFYDEHAGRIEMHLESRSAQSVRLGEGRVRDFAAGERIHTENSHKYGAGEFEALLGAAGFASVTRWTDAAESYFVFHAA